MKRLKATLLIEYDVEPDHYPEDFRAKDMLQLDLDVDGAATLMSAETTITEAVIE